MGELALMFEFRTLALLPSLSALSILITIVFYLFRAKKSALLFSFVLSQFFMFLWPFGQAIQYLAADNQVVIFSIYVIHTSINFVGLTYLIFAIHFTSEKGTIDLKKLSFLLILPLLVYVIFLTNQYHHLYFKTVGYDPRIIISVNYGPFFWYIAIITYSYIIAGAIILAKYAATQTGFTKGQAIALIFGPILPLFLSISSTVFMFIAHIEIPEFFDLTPTFFAIPSIIYAIAVFRFRFLNIIPGALKKIFENLHDSILVVDNYHCIANLNDSFIRNFGKYSSNEHISSFLDQLKTTVVKNNESDKILNAIGYGIEKTVEMGKLNLTKPLKKTYEVIIQTLDHRKKAYRGRIITFHDVTEYNRLLEELNQKNHELFAYNQKLTGYLNTVEELAVANERNRVSRELHDTLGHSLTLLIMLMKAAKIEAVKNPPGAKEKLVEGIRVAQTELNELRTLISGLLSNDMDIFESIGSLGLYMKNLGIHIEFSVMDKNIYSNMASSVYKFKLSDTIYKITKEAITNSLRHGSATEINIIVKFHLQKVNLFIIDNGSGCRNIVKGFGLSGMEERVNELHGTIKFGSDGESGFNIHVELPMEVNLVD